MQACESGNGGNKPIDLSCLLCEFTSVQYIYERVASFKSFITGVSELL